ncbi:MAG: PAS domain S-box protein, partial [Desulfobulbaceae bacterium]|nr:PAS domain S-box protein [Desulfobulbaceae bacterium]
RKGDAGLRIRLNKAVAELLESREYKNIYTKWYGVRQRGEISKNVFYFLGLLVVVGAIIAALWRYRTIVTLNGELASAVEKQEKTALRLHQAMFALEKVGEAVFWIELSGRFFYVNEAAMHRLGYTWHELTQMSVWDIDPDYTEEIWPEFIDHLKVGVSMTFQTRHRTKNGTIFPVEIKSQYLVYEEKMFICAFAQDITERLATEKSLAESELRQRAILENVADSIVTIDQLGIIETFNPAAERAFGYRASEVIGKNVSILMPEPECHCHDQYLARYLAGESRKTLCGGPRETVAKRKDNSIFPIDLSVSEMMLDGKRIFIGVILDISDRKQSEEKIIRQKSELEAARQAEDLKSKFLAIVSHELRTPLTPIIGFAEKIIKKQPPIDKVTLYAEHICQNAKHLQEIINDLLDFSRIESGRMPLDIKPVALSTVFDQLHSSIIHLVETKNLQLKLEIQPEISLVAVDVLRLKQILFNLVSNAVKFTPVGGLIAISARMDGEMVLIVVRDTGQGISATDQLVIFDHFVQVQRQQNEQQGTGLGLAIAKKLVELHSGKIWVESKPGQGTAFFFTLPT